MIQLQNISFEFGGRYLYKNSDWHIKPGERIGLVGKNGTGKSTLLRLITEEFELREGNMQKSKNLKIGFLNQDLLSFNSHKNIRDVGMQAFEKALQLEKEIEEIGEKLAIDYSEELLTRLGEKQTEFESLDGYNIKNKTEEILEGLGFSTSDLDRPFDEFSGGWRMRVLLAKLLLQEPDLLLLDEPTNHLDLPSIQWIESYLQSFKGTVIVVSHDRHFINRIATKIVEIAFQKLFVWTGNYDQFLKLKEERDDLQQRKFENQKQYIKEQEKFIERFRYKASKSAAVQSRVKMLDKLDVIEEVQSDNVKVNINFTVKQKSGKVVCELENVSKSFDAINILKNADASVLRGDKIALIGANGKGKSTVLRILAGTETFQQGKRTEGYNVQKAFYAQHQLESLHLNNEILQELVENSDEKTETELRTILGCFLFSGDEVYKPIKVLSGGEKARVALAKTLVTEANFLLLDEPTNHLDMQSIEILSDALKNYQGSYVLVSHDRYFIQKTAEKIWWIENGLVKEYPGTYDEFNEWYERNHSNHTVQKREEPKESSKNSTKNKDNQSKIKQDLKKVQSKANQLETKVNELLAKQKELETEMLLEENINNYKKMTNLANTHQINKKDIAAINQEIEYYYEKIIILEETLENENK